jgi:hypothetical protein
MPRPRSLMQAREAAAEAAGNKVGKAPLGKARVGEPDLPRLT